MKCSNFISGSIFAVKRLYFWGNTKSYFCLKCSYIKSTYHCDEIKQTVSDMHVNDSILLHALAVLQIHLYILAANRS
jgi:hypothetical protein